MALLKERSGVDRFVRKDEGYAKLAKRGETEVAKRRAKWTERMSGRCTADWR